MRILVIGATRGIGFEVVKAALQASEQVRVLARRPKEMRVRHENLEVMQGDVTDLAAVEPAVADQDLVCCTVGILPTRKPVEVFSRGTRNILEAMQRRSVERLITVTGIGAGDSRGHGGFLYDRIFQPLLLGTIYRDKDRQEELIEASGSRWTIVRPGFLTNGRVTGRYRTIVDTSELAGGRISRADVAHFILKEALSPEFERQKVHLVH